MKQGGAVAVALALWGAVATLAPPHVFPGPLRVLATLVELRAELAADLGRTALRVVGGYTLAVAAGLPAAAAMALSPRVERQVAPLVSLLRPIPPMAWAPLLLLWLGVGHGSAVLVVFAAAFFPIVRLGRAAIAEVPASTVWAGRNLGLSGAALAWRVVLPAARPGLRAALGLGWSFAWMSVVAAELVGADGGLGQRILDARNLARPDVAVAAMVVIGGVAAATRAPWRGR